MDLIEKLIEEAKVKKDESEHENSRSRLKAVDGEGNIVRQVGVQHKPSAKIAKSKFTKPCNSCCCLSHCEKNPHKDDNDVEVKLDQLECLDAKDDDECDEVLNDEPVDMLDRSWMSTTAYEAELVESVPLLFSQDKFMEVLCSVNMDLRETVVEEGVLVD